MTNPKATPMSSKNIPRLRENSCGLLVIDMQERFASVIADWQPTLQASIRLIRFFHLIQAPIVVTEQYPKGLGHTVAEIRDALEAGGAMNCAPTEKTTFSSCGSAECEKALEAAHRDQWVLCGIETQVCVQQTAFDLLELGRETFLAVDAIGSRRPLDREVALERMARAGAVLSTSESLIFETLRDSTHPLFKQASALVK